MEQNICTFDHVYVDEHLKMKDCIDLMAQVFCQVEEQDCTQYLRTAIKLPNQNILGIMPAYFNAGYFGTKILSVYPHNSQDGYPSHQGQILLFESDHGQVEAIADATSVTRIRTGAASAAASVALARKESKCLALLGAGEQAESHLEAMLCCFPIEKVFVWNIRPARAEAFAVRNRDKYGLDIEICASVKDAVKGADIICTLTPSATPILEYAWVKPGAHINAVGACSAICRELDSALIKAARVYGDNIDSVMHESGDFLIPMQEGVISKDHLLGTIGQVLLGQCEGRTSDQDITIFDALGMAVEDIASVQYLYDHR